MSVACRGEGIAKACQMGCKRDGSRDAQAIFSPAPIWMALKKHT
jgi:hypothetical protein